MGRNSTRFQQYRQVPSHEFSPLQTYTKLPTGAYIGQKIELESPDSPTYKVAYYKANVAVGINEALEKNHTIILPTVASAAKQRANQIKIDIGTAVAAENQFAYGKLHVSDDTDGVDNTYYVWRNTAKDSDGNIVLYIDGDFATDIKTTYTLSVTPCPYYLVTQADDEPCAGFNEVALPAIPDGGQGVYFLALQAGIIRANGHGSIGDAVSLEVSTDTPGAVQQISDGDFSSGRQSRRNKPIGFSLEQTAEAARLWIEVDL